MVVRLLVLAAGVAALAVALLAHTSLGAEGVRLSVDCDGQIPQLVTECQVHGEQPFQVAVLANDAPAAGFVAYQAKLRWNDTVLDYRPSVEVGEEVVWPDCAFSARNDNRPNDTSVLFGCAAFPVEPSDYSGPLLLLEFVCIGNGDAELTLVEREGDFQAGSHFIELDSDEEQTLVDPKLTGAVVSCVPSILVGDASCDGVVNPLDAALILQLAAGLIDVLPCPGGGDTNGDGITDPLDAALVLQFSAGLINRLPP